MNKKDSKKKKTLNLMEGIIKISNTSGINEKLERNSTYYLIYFIDEKCLAIFKSNLSSRKKIELPIIVIYIEDLQNVNFRIPQKLLDMTVEFHKPGRSLDLVFGSEARKNEIGDRVKKEIKKGVLDPSYFSARKYTVVEFKYKIAKMLEGRLIRCRF